MRLNVQLSAPQRKIRLQQPGGKTGTAFACTIPKQRERPDDGRQAPGNHTPERRNTMKINKLRMLASDKGFTLIELMIVIAIIGILAAIAIPNFISYRDKAFCSSAEKDASSLQGALADYFAIPSNRTFTLASAGNQITFPNSQTIRLSGANTGFITAVGNVFRIRVTDASGRCPTSYRTPNLKWSGFTYSLTM